MNMQILYIVYRITVLLYKHTSYDVTVSYSSDNFPDLFHSPLQTFLVIFNYPIFFERQTDTGRLKGWIESAWRERMHLHFFWLSPQMAGVRLRLKARNFMQDSHVDRRNLRA